MQIQRSEDQHHGYFEVFLNHSLNVSHTLSTISVSRYIQCASSCLQNVLCFSFNVATVQDINSKQYACQLLPTDKFRNPDDFVLSQEFHHYATPVCFIWTCTSSWAWISFHSYWSLTEVLTKLFQLLLTFFFVGPEARRTSDKCASWLTPMKKKSGQKSEAGEWLKWEAIPHFGFFFCLFWSQSNYFLMRNKLDL